MSFEIGPLQPIGGSSRARRVDALTHDFSLEVCEAIGAAAARAAELRAENRELHFRKDRTSGRVIVEVRDLDGNVIRTIPPSHALEVMTGAAMKR
jgi:hypothetical protein